MSAKAAKGIMLFGLLPRLSVRSSWHILLPQYLMNGLSKLVETYREYSLVHTYDLIRFWRSTVKVTTGRQGHILLSRYVINGLSNLNETYREYSLVPTNDLIRCWRSKVNVTAGRRRGEGIHVDAGSSKSIFWLLPFLMTAELVTYHDRDR